MSIILRRGSYLRHLSILIFLPQKGIRKKEDKNIPHSNLIIYFTVGIEGINYSATLTQHYSGIRLDLVL